MTYDVDAVRSHFPALDEGAAHFDGPGGSQVPREVGAAVAATLTAAIANRGTTTAAEQRAEGVVRDARQAAADLLGADARGVVFGRSMTQLTMDLARTMAATWRPGDEVVVTRLDHDANIRPWVLAAEPAGATVRWADFDVDTAELPVDAVTALLTDRTKVVAVTGASNLLGTRPDLPAIAATVHDAGALLAVDGVHLTPHAPVDVRAFGADTFTCSPYKFLGPHHGVLVADPTLLETLHPAKLLPASDAVPERFELGTLPYELLAGTTAAVDFLAGLVPGDGSRREQVLAAMGALEAYEAGLLERLLDGLGSIDGVTRHGAPKSQTPTVLFSVRGHDGPAVHRGLAARGVNAPAGNFYALEASRHLGLGDAGAVRAGLAPYTTADEVDRLLAGVAEPPRRRWQAETMAHFLMEYHLVDDYLDRRPPLRPEHLALATAAVERGDLLLAGALADPVDRAVFVFTDGTAAADFANADPYVREGLVRSWTVRPWTVVVGEGAAPVV